jgi:putative hemolysin
MSFDSLLCLSMRIKYCAIGLALALGGLSRNTFATESWLVVMANPAAVACKEAGGTISKIYTDKGEQGMCTLPSGLVCEEWAFFKGACGQDKPSSSPSATEPVKPSSSEVRK